MSEPDCQYCGAKFFTLSAGLPKWMCGTVRVGSDQGAKQSPKCRIAQLEAETKRLTRHVELLEAVMDDPTRVEILRREGAAELVEKT